MEAVEQMLKKQSRELEQLKQKVLPVDSLIKERDKVHSARQETRQQQVQATQSLQLVEQLLMSIQPPRSGSPSSRAPGRIEMAHRFAFMDGSSLHEAPIIETYRSQSDRGRQIRSIGIARPVSPRMSRPRTVRMSYCSPLRQVAE
jgi:hypothetical protein